MDVLPPRGNMKEKCGLRRRMKDGWGDLSKRRQALFDVNLYYSRISGIARDLCEQRKRSQAHFLARLVYEKDHICHIQDDKLGTRCSMK